MSSEDRKDEEVSDDGDGDGDGRRLVAEFEPIKSAGYGTPIHGVTLAWTAARVVDIYDGDSIHLVVSDRGVPTRIPCRMLGLDTCEMRARDPEVRSLARQARARLASLVSSESVGASVGRSAIRSILSKRSCAVCASSFGVDKYGRYLVRVRILDAETGRIGRDLSKALIDEALAVPYDGGTRLSEAELKAALTSARES